MINDEQIQALKDKYGVPEVLLCDMCGHDAWRTEEADSLTYACDNEHVFSTRSSGDSDVIALLEAWKADKALIAELSGHLRNAHAFIESTEAFGEFAETGIVSCDGAEWDIDASKAALSNSPEVQARALTVDLRKHSVDEVMIISQMDREYSEGWCSANDWAIQKVREACAAAGIPLVVGGE